MKWKRKASRGFPAQPAVGLSRRKAGDLLFELLAAIAVISLLAGCGEAKVSVSPSDATSPPTSLTSPGSAKLLFSSGFEGAVALSVPSDCWGTGCWQNIVGVEIG